MVLHRANLSSPKSLAMLFHIFINSVSIQVDDKWRGVWATKRAWLSNGQQIHPLMDSIMEKSHDGMQDTTAQKRWKSWHMELMEMVCAEPVSSLDDHSISENIMAHIHTSLQMQPKEDSVFSMEEVQHEKERGEREGETEYLHWPVSTQECPQEEGRVGNVTCSQ
ncbi:hypothetical protein HGM15179_012017 [Zosterops borbonicus]|uniref:Uncharacterized protein n=1 Tax=Zosterops borbonicus TaxID=364589 RepID=A0A8K1GB98_9PASS|nr:hypothetical protein HGM15179_012017 [Zosterops borbonicus]